MADESSTAVQSRNRHEFTEVSDYLNEQDPSLFVFSELGDEIAGEVYSARRVVTVIDGETKVNAKGEPKRHLQLALNTPDGEAIVDIRSQNQKEALKQALAVAGIKGLARGDFFRMTYTHNDAPIQRGSGKKLTPARGFECEVTPSS